MVNELTDTEIERKRWFSALIAELQGDRTQEELGLQIGAATSTVQDWLGKDGIAKTDPHKVRIPYWRAIAQAKGTTVDALLEEMNKAIAGEESGVKPAPKSDRSVYDQLAEMCSLASILQSKLQKFEKQLLGNAMCSNAVVRLIQAAFEAKRMSVNNPSHMRRFLNGVDLEDVSAEEIRLVAIGRYPPNSENIPAIAAALTEFTGTEYTQEELEHLNLLPVDADQGQDCRTLNPID
jgi:hypothetical protein